MRLVKKLGIFILEGSSIIIDVVKIIIYAGKKLLSGDDTDWKSWFYQYVPEHVFDLTILGFFSLGTMIHHPSSTEISSHKHSNEEAWKEYQQKHVDKKYIEDQTGMKDFKYGSRNGDYNACEVIAVYNALQYLTNGKSPDSFSDLLKQFETHGIVAGGEFGTSPAAVDSYFERNGYNTKMLVGNGISSSNILDMSENYDTYIMTAYNDKSDLGKMVHTVSITTENGKYVVHNDYEGTRSYGALEDAVSGYHGGKGESISLIGIKQQALLTKTGRNAIKNIVVKRR